MELKRSWVEIDLEQLKKNYFIYKNTIKEERIMIVIKANGYGHGDVECAKQLQSVGADMFAVSNITEGIRLRKAGIMGEILILGYTPIECHEELLHYDLSQTILSSEYAEKLRNVCSKELKVHIALDTGMNRIGLNTKNIEQTVSEIEKINSIFNVEGIYTHLCVADTKSEIDKAFTMKQIKSFDDIIERVKYIGIKYIHCMNSAGGLNYFSRYSNVIRLGIILYGLKPNYNYELPLNIKPILTWKSVVSMVKFIESGECVGYGCTYVACEPMRIATVSVGYADGYNRLLSNKGWIMVNGQKARIVGRICMDQFMVDVSHCNKIDIGTEVILLGQDDNLSLFADDMANMIDTIGYEVVCNITNRVERRFV